MLAPLLQAANPHSFDTARIGIKHLEFEQAGPRDNFAAHWQPARADAALSPGKPVGGGDVVVATGPLTSDALTRALSGWTGDKLYFYDSIAPIVAADSVDEAAAFRASRWGRAPLRATIARALARPRFAT